MWHDSNVATGKQDFHIPSATQMRCSDMQATMTRPDI